jgi:SAM-dependent methyltransferase
VGVDLSEKILARAQARVAQTGMTGRVGFACQALEQLAFADDLFDAIHCRGVLMHIPAWEKALEELIRVLKPGGKIGILELNDQSLESWMVRFLRRFRATQSTLSRTEAGLEFWSEEEGYPMLARVANIRCLERQLERLGAAVRVRSSSEFWDINRFPAGILRRIAIGCNMLWFALRLPSRLSSGNLIVGQKGSD